MFGLGGNSGTKQKMQQRGLDFFTSWGVFRKIGLGLLGMGFVLMVILGDIPVGLAALATLIMVSKLWKAYDDMKNPTLGGLTPETESYKLSQLVTVIKRGPNNRGTWDLVKPVVSLGMGAPEDEPEKEIVMGWFPPTRMTSWWALPVGFFLGCLDYAINPIIFPFWGDVKLPAVVALVLSGIGWYMTIQVIVAAQRYALAINEPNIDHYPAVLSNHIPGGWKSMTKDIVIAVSLAMVSTAFTLGLSVLAARFGVIPTWVSVAVTLLSLVSAIVFHLTSRVRAIYIEDVKNHAAAADRWDDIFYSFLKENTIPKYENEVAVPGPEDWAQIRPDELYDPHVWVATFSFPVGGTYDTYAGCEQKILPSMQSPNGKSGTGALLCVAPIPDINEEGEPMRGTVGQIGFRVWWTDKQLDIWDLVSGQLPPEEAEIAARARVINVIADMQGSKIGRCGLYSIMPLTTPDSPAKIIKIQVIPPDGKGLQNFLDECTKIKDALGVEWFRAMRETTPEGKKVISLYLGDRHDSDGIKLIQPATKVRNELNTAEWIFIYSDSRIISSSGSPVLLSSKPVTEESNELVFSNPSFDVASDLLPKKEKIRSSAGNAFMEISEGLPTSWSNKEKERKQKEFKRKHGAKSFFTVISAVKHPLDKMFPFGTYRDELIGVGREPGVAKPEWGIGMMSNGKILVDDFENSPSGAHLLIAGSSGSGKSVVLHNMISQLALKNNPADLEINIIEPKNGTQIFKDLDNVTSYVDSWTREGAFFEATRDLLVENVQEMERRNKLMVHLPGLQKPEKLAEARRMALKQGAQPDGSPNPLWMPYRILIIEECATVFTGCTDKEGKEVQAEILYYTGRIAREARSAGILMAVLTQYPTNISLPSLIRQQMRRIGLKAKDSLASDIIIGQKGLENLRFRGSLMAEHESMFRESRGFYLNHDFDDPTKDDVVQVLQSLPSRRPDGTTTQPGQPHNPYIDLPPIDTSVFRRWENTAMAQELHLAEDTGRLNKIKGFNYSNDELADPDFHLGTLEDFKRRNAKQLGLIQGKSQISMHGTGGIPNPTTQPTT